MKHAVSYLFIKKYFQEEMRTDVSFHKMKYIKVLLIKMILCEIFLILFYRLKNYFRQLRKKLLNRY